MSIGSARPIPEPNPTVRRVGVFVDEGRGRVEEIARIAALDVAQLHGGETPADYPASLAVWKAVRVGKVCDLPIPRGAHPQGFEGRNQRGFPFEVHARQRHANQLT